MIWWAIIPAIFVVLKHAGIALATVATSASIIERLGTFWPVLPEHYKQVQTVTSAVDANNLGLFYLALILFGAAAVLRIVLYYLRRRADVRANGKDVAVFAIVVFLTVVVPITDHVRENADPFFFNVDNFGFYYFSEAILASAAFMGIAMSIMLVSEFIKNSGRPFLTT